MTEAAEVLARHVSHDGSLVFIVERSGGTITFGFEGLPWHLHPDSFEAAGRSDERIALDVVDDLIGDRMVIVADRSDGAVEYSILETIELLLEISGTYAPLEFRFWSGRRIDRSELLEGSVAYKPLGEAWARHLTAAAPR